MSDRICLNFEICTFFFPPDPQSSARQKIRRIKRDDRRQMLHLQMTAHSSQRTGRRVFLHLPVCFVCVNTDCMPSVSDVQHSRLSDEMNVQAKFCQMCWMFVHLRRKAGGRSAEIRDLERRVYYLWLILDWSGGKKKKKNSFGFQTVFFFSLVDIDFPEFYSTLLSTPSQTAFKAWQSLTLKCNFKCIFFFLLFFPKPEAWSILNSLNWQCGKEKFLQGGPCRD